MDARRFMTFAHLTDSDLRSSKGYAGFRRGISPSRKYAD
ncbi:hypothetical protein SAMN05216604_10386 [Pseudomonas agarici]|nr:hypothetical protein SAMN05216604_10386 [Pseudomonas agarici]